MLKEVRKSHGRQEAEGVEGLGTRSLLKLYLTDSFQQGPTS